MKCPYTGHLIRSLREDMHCTIPERSPTRCYTGTKLGVKINNIKILLRNQVYYATCPEPSCVED